MGVRIAVVDSGVNPAHPHVNGVAGGIEICAQGESGDYLDYLGHGTAVMGAIRERLPEAELFAVKIFRHRLSTSIDILVRALEWCREQQVQYINLSLGTAEERHRERLQQSVEALLGAGITVVSPADALPGCLERVLGVRADASCARDDLRERDGVLYASPYPRPIPGMPVEKNLSGVSFAVANATGLLASGKLANRPVEVRDAVD